MSAQTPRPGRGVTLRHWTTDSHLFVGGRQGPSEAWENREVTDGRRLNLVAAQLRLIREQATKLARMEQ